MGAALGRGNQVDVAFLHRLTALGQPGRGPVHHLGVLLQAAQEQLRRQRLAATELAGEVIAQAVGVVPFVALAAGLVEQGHRQARGQHGLGAQQVAQVADRELRAVEILRIRPEAQAGAGVLPADAADDLQRRGAVAVGEGHVVLAALALDEHVDPRRQRVDHAHADAVQAAAEGVVLVAELAAGMQLGEDQLDARHAFFRVDVHRHAATVVGHLAAAVGVQDHGNLARVAGQGFVDAVVDDFLGQVVGAGGVGVHPRALAHRVEAGKDFDVFGVVTGAHRNSVGAAAAAPIPSGDVSAVQAGPAVPAAAFRPRRPGSPPARRRRCP